jgi:hypothetical protein
MDIGIFKGQGKGGVGIPVANELSRGSWGTEFQAARDQIDLVSRVIGFWDDSASLVVHELALSGQVSDDPLWQEAQGQEPADVIGGESILNGRCGSRGSSCNWLGLGLGLRLGLGLDWRCWFWRFSFEKAEKTHGVNSFFL